MYETALKSIFAQEYIAVCKEMSEYFADDKVEPAALSKRYKDVLRCYCDFLDSQGYKMPQAIYPYNKDDLSTHKYLDVKISADPKTGRVRFIKDIPNLNYRYRRY